MLGQSNPKPFERRPKPRTSKSSKSSTASSPRLTPSKRATPTVPKDTAHAEFQVVQHALNIVQQHSKKTSPVDKLDRTASTQQNSSSSNITFLKSSSNSSNQVSDMGQLDGLAHDLEPEHPASQEEKTIVENSDQSAHSFMSFDISSHNAGYRLDFPEVDYSDMTIEEIRAYEKTHHKHMDPKIKSTYKQSEKDFRKPVAKALPLGCDGCKGQYGECCRCDLLRKRDDEARARGEDVPPRTPWSPDQKSSHGYRAPNPDTITRWVDSIVPTSTRTLEIIRTPSIWDRCAKKEPVSLKKLEKPKFLKEQSESSASVILSEDSSPGVTVECILESGSLEREAQTNQSRTLSLNPFHRQDEQKSLAEMGKGPSAKYKKASVKKKDGNGSLAIPPQPAPFTPPTSPMSPENSTKGNIRIARSKNFIATHSCWNCWKNHHSNNCPDPKRTVFESEKLRKEVGVQAPENWKRVVRRSENGVKEQSKTELSLDSTFKEWIETCWNCWEGVHHTKNCPKVHLNPDKREELRRKKAIQPTLLYKAFQKSQRVVVAGPGTAEWVVPSKCWRCRQYGHGPKKCKKLEPVLCETDLPPSEAWEVPETVEIVKDALDQKSNVSEVEGGDSGSDGTFYSIGTVDDDNVTEATDVMSDFYRSCDGAAHPYFGNRTDYIRMMPTEILDEIFAYLPASELNQVPNSDQQNYIRTGALELSVIEWNTRQSRYSCRAFRSIIQRRIYGFVHIQSLKSFEGFVRSVVENPELGELVKDVRVDIQQTLNKFVRSPSRPVKLGRNLAPTLLKMLDACPNLHTLSAIFWGSIEVMDILGGHYPNIKRLALKDDNDTSRSHKLLWRNLQRCPLVEEVTITHTENNIAVDFEHMRIHPSILVSQMQYQYRHLRCLKLVRSGEISDDNLQHLVTHMKELRTLELTDCKLITSAGLARALCKMKDNQLHHLRFVLYRDTYNRPTDLELATRHKGHLCQSIRDNCMHKLKSLHFSPHRICGAMFADSEWRNLQKVVLDTMDFVGCKENTTRNEVLNSFDTARFPMLRFRAQFQIGIPHVHFQRARQPDEESDDD